MRRKLPWIILILILLLATALRLYKLAEYPIGYHPDELDGYISVRNLIEKGVDLDGKGPRPYLYGTVEFHPPIYGIFSYIYAQIIPDTIFAIRFTEAVFGLISIVLLYYLTKELTQSELTSLLATLILSIIPWHIHFSRVGMQSISYLPFLLAAILLLLQAVRQNEKFLMILSFVFFGLCFYTYIPAIFYSPAFLSVLVLTKTKFFYQHKILLVMGAAAFLVTIAPFLWVAHTEPGVLGRANNIQLFKNSSFAESIDKFIPNYISQFHPKFLFITGDSNLRHSMGTGELYWWMLPFLVIGLFFVLKQLRTNGNWTFILLWLLIYPLAGALVSDGSPHAPRTLIGTPIFSLLAAIGITYGFTLLRRVTRSILILSFYIVIIFGLAGVSLKDYTTKYYTTYPVQSASSWGYEQKQLFHYIQALAPLYQSLCLTDSAYLYTPTILEYYLYNTHLQVIKNGALDTCAQPGTILVLEGSQPKPTTFKSIKEIYLPSGEHYYTVYTF